MFSQNEPVRGVFLAPFKYVLTCVIVSTNIYVVSNYLVHLFASINSYSVSTKWILESVQTVNNEDFLHFPIKLSGTFIFSIFSLLEKGFSKPLEIYKHRPHICRVE